MRYRKTIILSSIMIILFTAVFSLLLYFQYKSYTNGFNSKISTILENVIKEYPEIEKSALIKILNENTGNSYELFKEYGIDLEKESAVLANDTKFANFVILDISLLLLFAASLLVIFFIYNHIKDRRINDITRYIEEINKKNYKLDIEDNTEDELSILKNELYKTTVMLKEGQENSLNDKLMLKDSLSDISHQLKTPLTSIIIMLDNILDNKNMEESTKIEFIKDIKREIVNISFLVEAILKLSKFDSNSVKFISKEVLVKDIVQEAVKNVEMLRDLKNVNIQIIGNNTDTLVCDFKWQVEAITNILKNCIEHSNQNGKIDINYEKNNMYLKIEIKDYGSGIDKKDLPHIFERFYKGKDSSSDSVRNRTCSI